jgi:2-dehydro-3-deoxyphosphooctonate aldolase (KDO 8-P synthase)
MKLKMYGGFSWTRERIKELDLDKVITVVGGDSSSVSIGSGLPLVFIGGPCAIESESHSIAIATQLKAICDRLEIPFIFKSCYDKDCRSSADSFLGVGIDEGLVILEKVRSEVGVPTTTDISNVEWVDQTAEVVDLLQIPAYLCRQTHLLVKAGATKKPINIKKGQFMSPWNMKNSARKIEGTGNDQVMLSERGTFFGYNMLINDFRALKIMQDTGYPVCYDATHSVQLPTSLGTVSGGQREFIPGLVRAAAASGIHALFMEVHDDPDNARSDPATQLHLKNVEMVLTQAVAVHALRAEMVREWGDEDLK